MPESMKTAQRAAPDRDPLRSYTVLRNCKIDGEKARAPEVVAGKLKISEVRLRRAPASYLIAHKMVADPKDPIGGELVEAACDYAVASAEAAGEKAPARSRKPAGDGGED